MEKNNSVQFGINSDSNHSDGGLVFVEPETKQTPRLRKSTYYYCNITNGHRQTAQWQPCRARIITTNASNEPNKYIVELKDGDSHVSIVPEYCLAFRDLPFVQSNSVVGTRVIAQRDPNLLPHVRGTDEDDCIFLCDKEYGKFYAGIATEQIYLNQCEHLLVFFDDGHVQYVPSSKIRNVIGKWTWDAVNDNLANFVRYYNELKRIAIDSEFNLNFGQLKEEQIINVELDGRWQKAKVMINFHKIIKIQFEVSNRFEWLYCESPRFENTWRMINSNRILNECCTNGNNVIHLDDDDDGDDDDFGVQRNRNFLSRSEILDAIAAQLKEPTRLFVHHKCNRGCLSMQEKSMCLANQLVRPLIAGWQVVRINGDDEQKVVYITPCGCICTNMNEIHTFLMSTGSQLAIDCFTFDSSINCTRIHKESLESTILAEDISMGLDHLPIALVGHLNSGTPDAFEYTMRMYSTPGVPHFMYNPYRKVCCDCIDDCSDKGKCACRQMNNPHAQTGKSRIVTGYEYRRLQNRFDGGIYECHEGCQCRKNCFNRVAQQPLNQFLEIFKTDKCGWGLRCLNDLPKGTFVTCYFGEVLPDRMADTRAEEVGDTYFYNLNVTRQLYGRPKRNGKHNTRAKIEIVNYFPVNNAENIDLNDNLFLVDAKLCGNSARFLNHSCDPNMFTQDVYIETHDDRFPRLAFFTKRNVQAGEELTIDYGYQPIEGRSMVCKCKAKNCRKRLL